MPIGDQNNQKILRTLLHRFDNILNHAFTPLSQQQVKQCSMDTCKID